MMVSQSEIDRLPTTKFEDYKYTNIQKLFSEKIALAGSSTQIEDKNEILKDAHTLVFQNGQLIKKNYEGFKVLNLSETSEKKLLEIKTFHSDPLIDLNKAFMHSGYLIEIDSTVAKPIIIKHVYDELRNNLTTCHIVIWAKEGNANIVEIDENIGQANTFIQNRVTNIHVEKNANIQHTKINKLDHGQNTLDSTTADINRDGIYEHILINAGGSLSRHNYHLSLNEENAHTGIFGLYAGKNDEHIDTQIFVHHKSAHTTSDQIFKSTLDDSSKGIFTGMVRVEKGAQLINAKQLNKNLLLSPKAKAHSRPQLEIYADDVKCSHGSTTGQLSLDELFYFEARGIKPDKASRMLIKAIGRDITLKIRNSFIRELAEEAIDRH